MTVYLDMIFLLNCLTDAAALYVTGRLSGLPLERKRVLAASLLGGTYGALCALPGWGAAASLLPQAAAAAGLVRLAFGRREAAVDGNVLRVTARITGDSSDISTPAMKKKVTQALTEVIPLDAPGDFNQALMELGATVCLPNGAPLCEKCPAAGFCRAFQEGRTGELPVKAAKKARRVEERTVYLLFWGDCVALRRRPERGLLAGLWEYPNELSDESGWLERWGLSAALETAGRGKHIFSHIEWRMTALAGELESPELPEGWVWADRRALRDTYAVPNAFQSFAQRVAARLGRF